LGARFGWPIFLLTAERRLPSAWQQHLFAVEMGFLKHRKVVRLLFLTAGFNCAGYFPL